MSTARRDFLKGILLAGCGPLRLGDLLSGLGAHPAATGPGPGSRPRRRVDLAESLPGRQIQCHVCPMNCILEDGQTCFCRTRTNYEGVLYTDAYDEACILRLDSIEKLPLHHYEPGSKALSVAVGGCNLRCQYCQNWAQAGKRPGELQNLDFSSGAVATALKKNKIKTLALAYTEPIAFLEYALDLSSALQEVGLKMVAATAAYANKKAMTQLAKACAAMTLALKGMREDFYRKVCGVHLAPVLAAIEAAKNAGTWIELTNLIVPTLNDSDKEATDLARWVVRNLGKDVPLHIARFVPNHQLRNLPRTPIATLERARKIAQAEGLRYVYLSNVAPHAGNHSYCAKCEQPVIRRLGFVVLQNRLRQGKCPKCRKRMPGLLAL